MDFACETRDSYAVEISGWDETENFFVERSALVWGRDHLHEVSMRTSLRKGSIVFVRLIQKMIESAAFPIAYQAVELAEPDGEGFVKVRLAQMHPKHREEPIEFEKDLRMRVA